MVVTVFRWHLPFTLQVPWKNLSSMVLFSEEVDLFIICSFLTSNPNHSSSNPCFLRFDSFFFLTPVANVTLYRSTSFLEHFQRLLKFIWNSIKSNRFHDSIFMYTLLFVSYILFLLSTSPECSFPPSMTPVGPFLLGTYLLLFSCHIQYITHLSPPNPLLGHLFPS